jgi:hypothetical protein
MSPHPHLRSLIFLGFAVTALAALAGENTQAGTKPPGAQASRPTLGSRVLEAVLPKSMQKRPLIFFSVLTEMTEEGRKRRQPSPENPMYYRTHTAKFTQMGWSVSAGERPPPTAELEGAVQKALAANGYLAATKTEIQPEILVILTFGSHGTDPASTAPIDEGSPPVTAGELVPLVVRDLALFKDVISRASLVGGEKFATELKAALDNEVRNIKTNQTAERAGVPIHVPVSPEFGSPFQDFMNGGKNRAVVEHLSEMVFHTCYFVLASAYDYAAAEKNEKRLLWRTKMTVEAQGVSMEEILGPLVANTGSYLGREMSEPAVVKKRIDRDGKVEIGTPTVVGDGLPNTLPK